MNFTSPISPFLKWPGGKTSELDKIIGHAPKQFNRYIDPFVGGGSVLLSVSPRIRAAVNDICPELIHLYQVSKQSDRDFEAIANQIDSAWSALSELGVSIELASEHFFNTGTISDKTLQSLIENSIKEVTAFLSKADLATFGAIMKKDLPKKIQRMFKLQVKNSTTLNFEDVKANIEGSIKSSLYMMVRARYNVARLNGVHSTQRDCDFFFLREYAYASMFRFNASGGFNVPYGGVSYNNKKFALKYSRLYSDELHGRLKNTELFNLDWKEFLQQVSPNSNDFIFIDPPYDSDFSDYDNRSFDVDNQTELAHFLSDLDAKIMIVIGDTPLIRQLYSSSKWNTLEDEIAYKWTIKSRNNRSKNHLTIRNYS